MQPEKPLHLHFLDTDLDRGLNGVNFQQFLSKPIQFSFSFSWCDNERLGRFDSLDFYFKLKMLPSTL